MQRVEILLRDNLHRARVGHLADHARDACDDARSEVVRADPFLQRETPHVFVPGCLAALIARERGRASLAAVDRPAASATAIADDCGVHGISATGPASRT